MSPELAGEIIACLVGERTLFRYARDRFARLLLSRLYPEGARIAEIRQGPYARLVDRPSLKPALAKAGNGRLTPEALAPAWAPDERTYRLTLDRWGPERGRSRWHQCSRPGQNLVLQLNFAGDHNVLFRTTVDPYGTRPLDCWSHPSRRDRDCTLAWARIDLDLDTGEALIEEVQSDWVRRARAYSAWNDQVAAYLGTALAPHLADWDEAMLAAAVLFVVDEIGLPTVWYHTHETGKILKEAGETPRSLYSDLPRRFAFERVAEAPRFLKIRNDRRMRRLKREGGFGFYRMRFPVGAGRASSGALAA